MSDALLEIKDLSVSINTQDGFVTACEQLAFKINPGETFALLGESGCGKSLTALSINQLLPSVARFVYGSNISFANKNLLELTEIEMRQVRRSGIGMIFQEPMSSLNPVLSIGQQIEELLVEQKLNSKHRKQRVIELLQQVGLADPERRYFEYPHQLSGGMKQRVMIAMSLAAKPKLLIADEPTTALDVTIQAQILQLLKKLQQQEQMAILLISHDLGVIAQMADHVAVMYGGMIVEQASAAEFFKNPSHPYSKKLFSVLPSINNRGELLNAIPGQVPSLGNMPSGCRFVNRCNYAWQHCETNAPDLYSVANQHTARCHLFNPNINSTEQQKIKEEAVTKLESKKSNAEEVLKIEDLQVHFPIRKGILKRQVGSVKAVDGISLTLHAGKTLALVGESGCGKSTLGKAILHLVEPTNGSTIYQNINLADLSGKALNDIRQELQIVFQDPFSSLNPRMLVGDLILEGITGKNRQDLDELLNDLLSAVGLPANSKDRYPHEFSGGQRQRICIARALAVKPKVIICDEPTSALDVSVQAQILNLLKKLQQDYAIAFLLITHDMSVVSYMADDMAVMYLGRIVEQGKVETLLSQPKHPYTQLLLSTVPSLHKGQLAETDPGEQPSPENPPQGCHFSPRCPHVKPQCQQKYPVQQQLKDGRYINCYLY